MKKIIAFLICLCLTAALFAGCGVEDALYAESKAKALETTAPATADEATDNVKAENFENSFDGLCKYFTEKLYIVAKKGDKPNETKMDTSLIGAKEGKKFATSYGGKPITIELYSYDISNLNDTANEVINSVKTDGTFTIRSEYQGSEVEMPAVTAYISDNGQYLMIYTDASINSEKPDTESDNYKHREKVIEDFKSFHK